MRKSFWACNIRNAESLMLSAPYLAHIHSPRWPVGRRFAPNRWGISSTDDPTRCVTTKLEKSP